jgi:hypothetical protein
MADAPNSTAPTCPRKAVSVTFTIFWATRLIMIGQEITQIFRIDGVLEGMGVGENGK